MVNVETMERCDKCKNQFCSTDSCRIVLQGNYINVQNRTVSGFGVRVTVCVRCIIEMLDRPASKTPEIIKFDLCIDCQKKLLAALFRVLLDLRRKTA